MEVTFKNRYLRDICERKREAEHVLGKSQASSLRAFLSDCESVTYVTELPLWPFCRVESSSNHLFNFDLCEKTTLTCKQALKATPLDQDGQLSWNKVSRIQIIRIG